LYTSPRVKVFTHDLCNPITDYLYSEIGDVHYIIHLAAETHVDNSIKNPVFCIQNNVMSTTFLLEYARSLKTLEKFFYFSTDEVFGSAPEGVFFKELDRHNPTNPYSASKSASESICVSYANTYKVPVIIVNVMNAFGERQHVEKFIPKCIKHILEGRELEIHCDETCKIPGSRLYIHARNIASAVLFLLETSVIGERYNISGEKEVDNLEMAKMIAVILGKPLVYKLTSFCKERPGHDMRYSLDGTKLKDMGWVCPVSFEESLRNTILWTLKHPKWLLE
jgi:dTDP-glucose 4,6-dehydratase